MPPVECMESGDIQLINTDQLQHNQEQRIQCSSVVCPTNQFLLMWSYFCKVNLYKVLTTFTVTTLAYNHTKLAPFPVLLRSSPENELDQFFCLVSCTDPV